MSYRNSAVYNYPRAYYTPPRTRTRMAPAPTAPPELSAGESSSDEDDEYTLSSYGSLEDPAEVPTEAPYNPYKAQPAEFARPQRRKRAALGIPDAKRPKAAKPYIPAQPSTPSAPSTPSTPSTPSAPSSPMTPTRLPMARPSPARHNRSASSGSVYTYSYKSRRTASGSGMGPRRDDNEWNDYGLFKKIVPVFDLPALPSPVDADSPRSETLARRVFIAPTSPISAETDFKMVKEETMVRKGALEPRVFSASAANMHVSFDDDDFLGEFQLKTAPAFGL